jgi:hypothetical protein
MGFVLMRHPVKTIRARIGIMIDRFFPAAGN